MAWNEFVQGVKGCHICKNFPKVKAVPRAKPWNGCDPPDPRNTRGFPKEFRVLFISEAPPGGSGTFFWRDAQDRLRVLLFQALREAHMQIREGDEGLEDFKRRGYYLLPSFCYPCGVKRDGNVKNDTPSRSMIQHSAKEHIYKALQVLNPRDIILLGESALVLSMALGLRCFTTYWPHKRSGHWDDTVSSLRKALG